LETVVIDTAARARRFVEDVWNGTRPESAHDLVVDVETTLAWHADRRTSFPDVHYEIVDLVATDRSAAIRWHATGTQTGQFGPVPPTHRRADYNGATFLTFGDDGRIVDVWSVNELFQVLQQLGVTVTPPAG
jgi:predicted ester cyclase